MKKRIIYKDMFKDFKGVSLQLMAKIFTFKDSEGKAGITI